MTRRNGSIIKIVSVAVVLLLAVYFIYLFNDVSGRLKDTERTAERYRREHESVSAQLQGLASTPSLEIDSSSNQKMTVSRLLIYIENFVWFETRRFEDDNVRDCLVKVQFEHRRRLEKALHQEKLAHKSFTDDLNAAHEELRQRCDADKQEYINRLNSLNQQHKMLKSQHDDMESEYGKLQQENNKLKQDQKQMEEQRNQEYMQLKQEKDLEISNFRDKIANMEREKDKLTKDLESIKTQLQNNMIQINGDQQTMADLQKRLQDKQNQINGDQQTMADLQKQLQEKQNQINGDQQTMADLQKQLQEKQNQLIQQQSIIGQMKQQGVGQQGGFVNMQQGGGVNVLQGGGANVQQGGGANLKPLDGTFNQQGGGFHAQQVDHLRETHDQGGNMGVLHQQGQGVQGVLKDGAQNLGGVQNIAQNQGLQNLVNQIGGAAQQHVNQDLHQQLGPNANDGQHQIAPPGDHNKPQGYQRQEDKEQHKQEHGGGGNIVPPEHENKQILKPNLDEVVDNNGGEEHNFHPARVNGAADKQDPNAPKQVDLQVAPPQFGKAGQQPNQLPGHRDQGVVNFGQDDDDVEARNQKGPIEDDNNDDYNDDKYDKNIEADEDGKDDAL